MKKEKKTKKNTVLINDLNRFMYDHSLDHERKHFCCYCLHVFITEEILKCHIKDCFKLMINKWLRRLRKVNMLNSKILKEK